MTMLRMKENFKIITHYIYTNLKRKQMKGKLEKMRIYYYSSKSENVVEKAVVEKAAPTLRGKLTLLTTRLQQFTYS